MNKNIFLKYKSSFLEHIKKVYIKKVIIRKIISFFIVGFIVIFTSFLIRDAMLNSVDNKWVLVPGFLDINIVQNTGVAFSGFANMGSAFVYFIQTIPIIWGVGILLLSYSLFLDISLCLLIFGGLCNVIDRSIVDVYTNNAYLNSLETTNAVVDYFQFNQNFISNFAIFNMPDIFITVGVLMLISFIIFKFAKDYKNEIKNKNVDK